MSVLQVLAGYHVGPVAGIYVVDSAVRLPQDRKVREGWGGTHRNTQRHTHTHMHNARAHAHARPQERAYRNVHADVAPTLCRLY